MALFQMLFMLFCGHAIGDFSLQNDFLATNKNRHVRDSYTPKELEKMEVIWPWLLTSHAMHHGLIVFLITQNIWAGVLETIAHWIIDFGKCERWYSFHMDQGIHLATKVLWALLIQKQIL